MHICIALFWKLGREVLRRWIITGLMLLLPMVLPGLFLLIKHFAMSAPEYYNESQIFPSTTREILKELESYAVVIYATDEPSSPRLNSMVDSLMKIVTQTEKGKIRATKAANPGDVKKTADSNLESYEGWFGVIIHELNGTNLRYSIRDSKAFYWKSRSDLFPSFMLSGPLHASNHYFRSEFLQIQNAINEAFMKLMGVEPGIQWSLQEFPYGPYSSLSDQEMKALRLIVQYTIFLSFIIVFVQAISDIIHEKQSGIKELLRVNGVPGWLIFFMWFIQYYIICHAGILAIVFMFRVETNSGAFFRFTSGIVLYCFVGLFCVLCLCFAAAVSSFFNDVKFGCIVFLFLWLGIFLLCTFEPFGADKHLKLLSTVFPAGGLIEGLHAIWAFEMAQEHVYFESIFFNAPSDAFPIFIAMSGMLVGCLLFLFIAYIMMSVKPGRHGRAKPWHFLFSELYAKIRRRNESLEITAEPKGVILEKINTNVPVGIAVNHLTKRFGRFTAVNDLSMSIYKNQITILLGHNGAGKTTFMSMLAGFYGPTSGEIIADGTNISDDMKTFRKHLGYCPQEDMLLPSMSVWEHLVFFGLVRGLSFKEASENARTVMSKFGIQSKSRVSVKKLSGGMKRKLSLAVALCGNPTILLLDEPTSGLDPESRREVWDSLKKFKGDRTIILTTHHMEEADVLGDRIAIMASGALKCYGTQQFLKKYYGAGYQLSIFCISSAQANEVANVVLRMVNDSSVMSKSGNQVVIQLPSAQADKFPKLFGELELLYGRNIQVGVTCSKVDDIFLKVQREEGVTTSIDQLEMPVTEAKGKRPFLGAKNISVPLTLILLQMYAIILRKFIWSAKKFGTLFLMVIVIPFVFTILLMLGATSQYKIANPSPRLLKLSEYGKTKVVLSGNSNHPLYAAAVRYTESQSSEVMTSNLDAVDELLEQCNQNERNYRTSMIVAAEFSDKEIKALYSSIATHSAPIALDLLSHLFLKSQTIHTYNHPYRGKTDLCVSHSRIDLVVLWISCLGFALLIAPAFFIIYPLDDRVSQMKHLQIMTGLTPVTYWASILLMDIALWTMVIGLILAVVLMFDWTKIFVLCEFTGPLIMILVVYGFSVILFMYFLSFMVNRSFLALTISCAVPIASTIAHYVVIVNTFKYLPKSLQDLPKIFYLVPFVPFTKALGFFVYTYGNVYQCKMCHASAGDCSQFETGSWIKMYGIEWEIYFLIGDAILYALLILLIDFRAFPLLESLITKRLYWSSDNTAESADNDVVKEKAKVKDMLEEEEPQFALAADSLGKLYGINLVAVRDVTFAVDKGECFGLLGVNGAGKTTTFNMLTALVVPTVGNAYAGGYSVKWSHRGYLKNMGYCPQLNGLDYELSARQLLHFFGRLRGIRRSDLFDVTEKWIRVLEMTEIGDRACEKYSGGNKRKLSAALAIIGDFPIILLDEPTTGVDPVVRRKMWGVLKKCQSNGRTVIITSHSMDECEALCNRLTVMVDGRMKCIGPIHYLKRQYGKGYIMTLKLNMNITPEGKEEIKRAVESKFGNDCTLQDEYFDSLTYKIGYRFAPRWSTMFQISNDLKNRSSNIEDCTVSDISMEQLFLSFARAPIKRNQ